MNMNTDAIFRMGIPIAGGVALFVYGAFLSKEERRVRALTGVASLGILCWAFTLLVLRLEIPSLRTPASRWTLFLAGTAAGGIGAGILFALLVLGHLRRKRQPQPPVASATRGAV